MTPVSKKRIGTTLLRFKDNPLQYAERMTDPELGGYRFRIGDYRVIFDIEGNDIVVLRAGHHKEIYKRKEVHPVDAHFLLPKHPAILKNIHHFNPKSFLFFPKYVMRITGSMRGRGQRIYA